jgi:hypothetical protein
MIELAPKTIDKLDAYRAELYIWTCTHNGKNDWRFPTTRETAELDITGSWQTSDFENFDIEQMVLDGYDWRVVPVRDIC